MRRKEWIQDKGRLAPLTSLTVVKPRGTGSPWPFREQSWSRRIGRRRRVGSRPIAIGACRRRKIGKTSGSGGHRGSYSLSRWRAHKCPLSMLCRSSISPTDRMSFPGRAIFQSDRVPLLPSIQGHLPPKVPHTPHRLFGSGLAIKPANLSRPVRSLRLPSLRLRPWCLALGVPARHPQSPRQPLMSCLDVKRRPSPDTLDRRRSQLC